MRTIAFMTVVLVMAGAATIGGCGDAESPGPVDATGVWLGTVTLAQVGYNVGLTLTQTGLSVTGTFENLSLKTSAAVEGAHVSPDMSLTGESVEIDVSVGTNVMTGRFEDSHGGGAIQLTRQ